MPHQWQVATDPCFETRKISSIRSCM